MGHFVAATLNGRAVGGFNGRQRPIRWTQSHPVKIDRDRDLRPDARSDRGEHRLQSGNPAGRQFASIDRRDPQLSEICLFDALTALQASPKLRVERYLAGLWGKPFGVKSAEFSRAGAVVNGVMSSLDGFDRMHVAPGLFELGQSHFYRYGARAEVKLSTTPSLFHMTFPTPLRTRGCPNIYTIHDIVPLRLPQTTLDNKKQFLRLVRHLCRKADHIVTVSEFSRQDIIRFVGIAENRITNTYQSVHLPASITEKSDDEVANEVSHAFGLDFRSYYMFYGAIEPKKNVSRMIDAYAASGSAFPLIIVGGLGWQYDDDVEKIKDDRFLYYRREADRIRPQPTGSADSLSAVLATDDAGEGRARRSLSLAL